MTEYIIGTLLIILLLGIGYRLTKPHYLSFQRQKNYRRILPVVEAFYKRENPYLLSKNVRPDDANDNLIYGEIDLCALLDLLDHIKPTVLDVFYDLGSGSGKVLMATQLRYPKMKVVGIELLQPLHDLAEEIGQSHPPPRPTFICGNFLTYDFSDATILLINATAFSPALWDRLVARLQTFKQGTKIIVTSKKAPATGFIQRYGAMEKMSWGLCTTRIYEKL